MPAGVLADRLKYVVAEVPTWASANAAAALATALTNARNARGPGQLQSFTPPGTEFRMPPRTGTAPLPDVGSARQDGEAPANDAPVADAPAAVPGAPAPKKKKKNTAAKVAVGAAGALGVVGLIMKLRGR